MSTPSSNVPFIPENAPFSTEQRAWLNGFIAGMFSNMTGGATAEAAQAVKPLTILFGSQTGTAEALSKQFSKAAKKQGFEPKVVDMGSYEPAQLAEEKELVIITSTYGDGEPPDNAQALYEFIHSDSAPRLEQLNYSVLALGDTSYPDFCKCGADFDRRLAELGATCVRERVDCDLDYDEAYEGWRDSVLPALAECSGGTTDAVALPADEEEEEATYSKKNPFPAKLVNNYNLNGEGSAKETRHVEISLEGSGLSYEVGDALGVVPVNCPDLVSDILKVAGFDGEEAIDFDGDKIPLRLALTEKYDIRTLNQPFLKALAPIAKHEKLDALLESEKKEIDDYCWGREIVDALTEFSVKFSHSSEFVGILKKLSARLYSISSSPKAHPGQVHLTVGAVRYDSHGRSRKGICSTYLADRVGENAVGVYLHANKAFKLPEDDSVPVIMVGPGTGIAPFRAFLEERQATQAKGKNWLFFGDQKAACDYLYKEQLEGMLSDGTLERLDLAFSRDQTEKIYVQTRMIENAESLYQWLEEGAYFYVCGDASRMAKDVDTALHKIVEEQGNMSAEDAEAYIKKMKSEKRYARDVY